MRPRFITRPSLPMLLGACLLLATGCQTSPPNPSQASVPARAPLAPLETAGARHYRVRAELSDLRFLVYRAGALASFGHNHVIQARNIQGDVYIAQDFAKSGFTLTLPVADLDVDAPAARAVEGEEFVEQPSPQAVEGTRQNMLGTAELDVARYPEIGVRSVSLTGPDWGPDLTVRISLHGADRDITLPVAIAHCDGQLVVSGSFDLLQSEFGIKPLSLLGGSLQVADRVRVRFRLVATPDPSPAPVAR